MANLFSAGINTTTGRVQPLSSSDTLVDTSSRNIIGSNTASVIVPIDDMYQYSSNTFPSITTDGTRARIRAFDITTNPAFAVTFVVPDDYSSTANWTQGTGVISSRLILSPSTATGGNVSMLATYDVYQTAANTINSSGGSGATSITATTGPLQINTIGVINPSNVTGGISPGDLITFALHFDSTFSTFLGSLNVRAARFTYAIRSTF